MPFPYLYDPTGMLPANQVVDELHHVTPPVALDRANFIVPRAAPYFTAGLVIRTGAGALAPALIEGTDYIFTHHFVEASQHLNAPIYGSVMFMNRAYVGDVYLNYQTIGGAFTLDDYGVVESLTRSLYNIRTVTWDQILGVPVAFPVLPHPHDVADLTGMAEVVTMLGNILTALQGQGGNIGSLMSTLVQHIGGSASHNKSQVGLEHVQNYGMAGTPELTTLPANKYVSPEWVWAAIELFNLGEAGVSQSTESVVGITRYATDVEVIDQDNPLDTVAVTAAGMWLAIATNTERLAGATIVTGVDFNTPPYREDGYWAFTNAINTSITPSSGYISTKKAGTKAYQTETLDNGEISNRMYTGTAWTPWIRAYVATYYGTLPATILNGNIDLYDYITPGFYVFDTHNVIAHSPPAFGVASEYEMMVYQSTESSVNRCQVLRNTTADITAIRTFTHVTSNNYTGSWSGWTIINNITDVVSNPTNIQVTDLNVTGVYLLLDDYFTIHIVKSSPASGTYISAEYHGYDTDSYDNGIEGHDASGNRVAIFGAYSKWLRFTDLYDVTAEDFIHQNLAFVYRLVFTLDDHVTGLPPLLALVDKFYIVVLIVDTKIGNTYSTVSGQQWLRPEPTLRRQSISNWSRYYLPVPGCNFSIWKLHVSANLNAEIDATSIAIDDQLPGILYYTFHASTTQGRDTITYTYIVESDVGLVQLGWYPSSVTLGNTTLTFYKIKSPTTGVWTPAISY